MNMMVVASGDTAIVVDAGVMFPEPELLGRRPHHPGPDVSAAVRTDRGAGPDAWARGPHRRRAARPQGCPGAGLRHAAHACARRVEARGERPRVARTGCTTVRPRERVTVGSFTIEFLRVTHSMPDCVAVAIETPHGVIIHTGDFKIDQTPIDGEDFDVHRLAHSALRASWRCSPTARTSIAGASPGRKSTSPTPSKRSSRTRDGKIVVATFASSIYRMQIARRSGGAVRSPGGVRRPRHDRQLRDCATAGLSARSRRACRSRTATCATSRRRTSSASARGRRASRRRHFPGSPSTITAMSGWSLRTWSFSRRVKFRATRRRSAG